VVGGIDAVVVVVEGVDVAEITAVGGAVGGAVTAGRSAGAAGIDAEPPDA
jgi:hypothetical protein